MPFKYPPCPFNNFKKLKKVLKLLKDGIFKHYGNSWVDLSIVDNTFDKIGCGVLMWLTTTPSVDSSWFHQKPIKTLKDIFFVYDDASGAGTIAIPTSLDKNYALSKVKEAGITVDNYEIFLCQNDCAYQFNLSLWDIFSPMVAPYNVTEIEYLNFSFNGFAKTITEKDFDPYEAEALKGILPIYPCEAYGDVIIHFPYHYVSLSVKINFSTMQVIPAPHSVYPTNASQYIASLYPAYSISAPACNQYYCKVIKKRECQIGYNLKDLNNAIKTFD